MADDLSRLDEWFGAILQKLAPAERRKMALKLGQALRRSNTARMARNIQADGTAMPPRKPSLRDRKRNLRGLMFQRLRFARFWRIDPQPDSVTLEPTNASTDRIASTSQFGLEGYVGRGRDGRTIRARYAERRLLGFSQADDDLVLDVASAQIAPPPHGAG